MLLALARLKLSKQMCDSLRSNNTFINTNTYIFFFFKLPFQNMPVLLLQHRLQQAPCQHFLRSWHAFPLPGANKPKLKCWLTYPNRENGVHIKHSDLCGVHFTPSCFVDNYTGAFLPGDRRGERSRKSTQPAQLARSGEREKGG